MKIIILSGKVESTLFIYNAVKKHHFIDQVIIEEKVSAYKVILSRIKKLGLIKVINQLFFQVLISKLLKIISTDRISEIKKKYNLNNNKIDLNKITNVSSINDNYTINLIKKIDPKVIIVNGTRIISKNVLECTSAIFINTHAGITPEYRGVHGGYWSLINNDNDNCGVTIHLVDKGIDTGDIIFQKKIKISKNDNFSTYPFLQYGIALPSLISTLNNIKIKKLKTFKKINSNSKLFYHPTFTGYIYNRIINGVK